MSKREIASLACKILGIYITIQGINALSSMVLLISTSPLDEMASGIFINVIFSFVYILFGVLLWFFSDKLSGIMTKGESQYKEGPGIEVSDIQRVAFSVLGLYFIGSSLPNLVAIVLTSSIREQAIPFTQSLLGSVGVIARFIIGLGIFLGSQGLVGFLNNMRTLGLKKENDNIESNDQ